MRGVLLSVPGHGPIERGSQGIDWMIEYLTALDRYVRDGLEADVQLEDLLEARQFPTNGQATLPSIGDLNRHMDRLNVLATYRALERERRVVALKER
jgi:hypothetical protein